MMIVMKPTATDQEVQNVLDRVHSVGARGHVINGDELTVIGAIGDPNDAAGRRDLVLPMSPAAAAVGGKAPWQDPVPTLPGR